MPQFQEALFSGNVNYISHISMFCLNHDNGTYKDSLTSKPGGC